MPADLLPIWTLFGTGRHIIRDGGIGLGNSTQLPSKTFIHPDVRPLADHRA